MKILLFFFPIFIFADANLTVLDKYHDKLCEALITTSNHIDDYFIDDNRTTSSTTHAEFSTSIAMEANQKFENDVRLRLRLNLPKIQESLRLVFEDENSDDTLYDRTTLNDTELIDKSYYLRLEYFKLVKEKFNLVLGAGLRIRQGHLIPYLNLRSRLDLYKSEKFKSAFYNRFRFYSDGEIENILEFNSVYTFDDTVYTVFSNQLRYSDKEHFQILYDDVSLIKQLNEKKELNVGCGIRSTLMDFKDYEVEYYHVHTLYHHLFYKNWLYYQVAPSVLWRRENNFNVSYRLMLNLGIMFNNS